MCSAKQGSSIGLQQPSPALWCTCGCKNLRHCSAASLAVFVMLYGCEMESWLVQAAAAAAADDEDDDEEDDDDDEDEVSLLTISGTCYWQCNCV